MRWNITTLAVFPDRVIDSSAMPPGLPPTVTVQSVPNSITLGSDGAYYVGELTSLQIPGPIRARTGTLPPRSPHWRAFSSPTFIIEEARAEMSE